MARLADFPAGDVLFIDANCLLYHFLSTHPSCTFTVHRAELGLIRLCTSLTVLGEVRHKLMILEASRAFGLHPSRVRAYLRRHPGQIRLLRHCRQAIESLPALRVEILTPTMDIFLASQRLGEEYGLLTNDALILATLRAHRLRHLATADRDFRRVQDLTLWIP